MGALLSKIPGTWIVILTLSALLWLVNNRMESNQQEFNDKLQTLNSSVKDLTEANEANVRTIGVLKDVRELDYKVLSSLSSDLSDIRNNQRASANKIAQLEKDNEQVKKFQSSPVPVELACLLEPALCPSSNRGKN